MKFRNLPVVLGFLVLLFTLPAAVFLLSQRQGSPAGAKPSATALVYLWPQNFELPLGQDVTLEVKLDTKNQTGRRAEATLQFDPRFITIEKESITAPTGVTLAQQALNPTGGILQLSGIGDFKGNHTLATFKITGVGKGATEIKIAKAHIWDASGETDMLGEAKGSRITVK